MYISGGFICQVFRAIRQLSGLTRPYGGRDYHGLSTVSLPGGPVPSSLPVGLLGHLHCMCGQDQEPMIQPLWEGGQISTLLPTMQSSSSY